MWQIGSMNGQLANLQQFYDAVMSAWSRDVSNGMQNLCEIHEYCGWGSASRSWCHLTDNSLGYHRQLCKSLSVLCSVSLKLQSWDIKAAFSLYICLWTGHKGFQHEEQFVFDLGGLVHCWDIISLPLSPPRGEWEKQREQCCGLKGPQAWNWQTEQKAGQHL